MPRRAPQTRRALEERILTVAAGQHGVITRAQLLDLGISRGSIHRRLDRIRLQPLHRGVYGVGAFLPPKAPITARIVSGPRPSTTVRMITKKICGSE